MRQFLNSVFLMLIRECQTGLTTVDMMTTVLYNYDPDILVPFLSPAKSFSLSLRAAQFEVHIQRTRRNVKVKPSPKSDKKFAKVEVGRLS